MINNNTIKKPPLTSYCGGSSTWERCKASKWVNATDGKTWFKAFIDEHDKWHTLPEGMTVTSWN